MSPIISFPIAWSILFFIGIHSSSQPLDCEDIEDEQSCLDRTCCRWSDVRDRCVENLCLSSTTTTLPPFQTTEEAQETTGRTRRSHGTSKRQRKNVKPTRKPYPKLRKADGGKQFLKRTKGGGNKDRRTLFG